MAKVNFRHNKRQKELARKERQSERLARRGERPPEEGAAALVGEMPTIPESTEPDPVNSDQTPVLSDSP